MSEGNAAHNLRIMLPGPFVVFQGCSGDGMANTIDSLPNHSDVDDSDECSSSLHEQYSDLILGSPSSNTGGRNNDTTTSPLESAESLNEEGSELNNVSPSSSIEFVNTGTITDAVNDHSAVKNITRHNGPITTASPANLMRLHGGTNNAPLSLPHPPSTVAGMGYNSMLPTPPLVITRSVEESFVMVDNSDHSHNNLQNNHDSSNSFSLPSDIIDISSTTQISNSRYTNITPQQRHIIQRWNLECRQREATHRKDMLMQHANPQSGGSLSSSTFSALLLHGKQWWRLRNGCLAVFESLPLLKSDKKKSTNSSTHEDCIQITTGTVIGDLPPGSTIMASHLYALKSKSYVFEDISDDISTTRQSDPSQKYTCTFLKIESPHVGYVLHSLCGYTFTGPGLPSYYNEPQSWTWRVTCPDGAFVRQGLELTSVHVDTIPYGSFVNVTRKTVNSMGLTRLRVEALLSESTNKNNHQNDLRSRTNPFWSETTKTTTRTVIGWVSESLNPLSGQSGPVVQPLPFTIPSLFRVRLAAGAVIRSDVELSSTQIGHAPFGAILTIVGRAFSEEPSDKCIERLRLAGGGGWISVRLNRTPPNDDLVVEMIGIDGSFDPREPGLYHVGKQMEVMTEYNRDGPRTRTRSQMRRLSSIHDEDDSIKASSLQDSGELSANSDLAAVPTLYRSGVAGGCSLSSNKTPQSDERCLICLTDKRTATIVHGNTGHIACCLTCARILKARGDKCPVCRLPIDSVIQQFWA